MDTFKIPSTIPQDLLLIHELVGADQSFSPSLHATSAGLKNSQDSIESSGDEDADSEDEVEANLLDGGDENPQIIPVSSDSESDSSYVSDESEEKVVKYGSGDVVLDELDEEDASVPGPASYTKTFNEVTEDDIEIPEITQVDPDELLEKVGEIVSILDDKIVIVKGIASSVAEKPSERALDSDSLLVYEDRKVMGFIYETFGPTSQPLYQVRFNDKFPLDLERAQVSRPVFHMPRHSKFIFPSYLKQYKGSDASNAHDEEPGEDEVEFSDDEQEAAYKRMKREGRSQSRENFSRQGTPSVSRRKEHDYFDSSFGHNPYDEHGPYDMDYGGPSSRPAPAPYNDPYSDSYSSIPDGTEPALQETISIPMNQKSSREYSSPTHTSPRSISPQGIRPPKGRGRGRGRGVSDWGRKRGRGRGYDLSAHGGRNLPQLHSRYNADPLEQSSLPIPIAPDYSQRIPPPVSSSNWSHQPLPHQSLQPNFVFGLQQNLYSDVQPHINPRFASQFGFNFVSPSEKSPQFENGSESSWWHNGQESEMGDN